MFATFQVQQSAGVCINELRTHATNTSTTTNYTKVAYDWLTCNMASATLTIETNSK